MKEELTGIDSQISEIEDELARTKYNKATQFHVGKLKAKLAKLKEQQDKVSGGGAHGYGYGLKKTGDSTALMIGFPSVGKSTLLNALTNADSKIGAYDFTTIDVVPGMLLYNSSRIQILDLPGLIEGASSGMGRGKEVLSVARIADLVLLTTSAQKAEKEVEIMKNELYKANFRLDMKPPEIKIFKKVSGGLSIGSTMRMKKLDTKTIQEVLKEFGIINADIIIREDCDIDRLIDGLRTNRVYVKSQIVITKADTVNEERKKELEKRFPGSIIVSSLGKIGIEELKKIIWEKSGLIRVYLKRIGKEPDMKEPLIMRKGDTVSDVMKNVHRRMEAFFKYARVWGDSTKFPGQKLGLEHKLSDKDIVELHF
jgi:uncharacterized protein